ncbi:nucleotide sugar dehydrogenase [Alphaproteobacteria bacterium]|nr:nucleotide sugar dehydrogenase [Alphaproteobacteria bacterium]
MTLAVAMAQVGFRVIGVERQPEVVAKLREGRPHFYEPKLPGLLRRTIQSCDLTIHCSIPPEERPSVYVITVGTPLDDNGQVRLDMVEEAARSVAEHSADGALVVMRSTLRLGTTRNIVTPILAASGKPFELAFCPERTIEGHALSELRHLPQIVGGMSHGAALRAATMFQFLTPTVVRVSEPETAEMIKMIDNTHRDISFAFSNEVARACDAAGVSAVDVIRSGKLGYPRTNLYMPGPVGGPCLSKDPHILSEGLRKFGVDVEIALTARHLNERQPTEVAALLARLVKGFDGFPEAPKISLLGLAFKGRPETNDMRGTMAMPIFSALLEHFPDADFHAYDAMVSGEAIREFGVRPCACLDDAFADASLVLILNNHMAFELMPLSDLATTMRSPGLVYDLWNNFSASDLQLPVGVGYAGLGNLVQAILPNHPQS